MVPGYLDAAMAELRQEPGRVQGCVRKQPVRRHRQAPDGLVRAERQGVHRRRPAQRRRLSPRAGAEADEVAALKAELDALRTKVDKLAARRSRCWCLPSRAAGRSRSRSAASSRRLAHPAADAGAWTWRGSPEASEAIFSDSRGPQLVIRCTRATRRVSFSRTGAAPGSDSHRHHQQRAAASARQHGARQRSPCWTQLRSVAGGCGWMLAGTMPLVLRSRRSRREASRIAEADDHYKT
jgi:hypothetical protein